MTTSGQTPDAVPSPIPAPVLLAGIDTIYLSCDFAIGDAGRAKLGEEKRAAQLLATGHGRAAHCPAWLGARVAPQGARGGYAFLIETADFAVKLLAERFRNRP